MRFSLLMGTAVLLASACFGQSGSEVIPPPVPPDPNPNPTNRPPIVAPGMPPDPHCPCDGLRDHQQIRATVLGVEAIEPFTNVWRYQLRADGILSQDPSGESALRAGDRFGGYWNGQLGCEGMAEPIAAGAEVLAFYQRGRQDGALCCEYIGCSDECRPEVDPNGNDEWTADQTAAYDRCLNACEEQTATACAEHREEAVMRGELILLPWGDSFVVGKSEAGIATITADDLPALGLERDACMAALDDRFDTLHPPPPPSSMDAAPASDPAPSGGPPQPEPPAPSQPAPMTPPMQTPPPYAATPDAGVSGNPTPPINPASMPTGGPPPHPEEVRVRCQ